VTTAFTSTQGSRQEEVVISASAADLPVKAVLEELEELLAHCPLRHIGDGPAVVVAAAAGGTVSEAEVDEDTEDAGPAQQAHDINSGRDSSDLVSSDDMASGDQ